MLLDIALFAVLITWAFWHGYVHAMGLYRAKLKGRLVGLPLLMSLPVVAITFVLDIFIQFTVASLIFWEWPRDVGRLERRPVRMFGRSVTLPVPTGDLFVTHRLRRYIAAGPSLGWRFSLADVVCHRFTDPFDPTGAHCDSDPPALAEKGGRE